MFSDEELRLQIIDVLKPTEDVVEDMNSLIVQVLSEDPGNVESATPSSKDSNTIGKIGIWKGPFDRQCVGVQMTSDKLQLFRKVKRCYYKLSDLLKIGVSGYYKKLFRSLIIHTSNTRNTYY